MNKAQQQHITRLNREFAGRNRPKYAAGCAEHGTELWTLPPVALVEHLMEEILDAWNYCATLRAVLLQMLLQKETAGGAKPQPAVKKRGPGRARKLRLR